MTAFVLVHGAWHGGWCWRRLADALRARGHDPHAPTLTGLGERAHLASREVTPDTHVRDVAAALEWRELADVVLVGHSYGGVIVTGVAGLMPERIRALVYLDAAVPTASGVSPFVEADPDRARRLRDGLDEGAFLVPPDRFDAWTDDPDLRAELVRKCTPQPLRCLLEGVTLTGREAEVRRKLHVLAERNVGSIFRAVHERCARDPGWETARLPTMHDAMLEAPDALADLLIDWAERPAR